MRHIARQQICHAICFLPPLRSGPVECDPAPPSGCRGRLSRRERRRAGTEFWIVGGGSAPRSAALRPSACAAPCPLRRARRGRTAPRCANRGLAPRGRAERVRPLIADSVAGHGLDLQPSTRSPLMASDAREPGILPTGARFRMPKVEDPALAHESIWPQILQPITRTLYWTRSKS